MYRKTKVGKINFEEYMNLYNLPVKITLRTEEKGIEKSNGEKCI